MYQRDLTSRLEERCLVQVLFTLDRSWRKELDTIATFKTSEDHMVLQMPGLWLAIPWEDLEDILERLEIERRKLQSDKLATPGIPP